MLPTGAAASTTLLALALLRVSAGTDRGRTTSHITSRETTEVEIITPAMGIAVVTPNRPTIGEMQAGEAEVHRAHDGCRRCRLSAVAGEREHLLAGERESAGGDEEPERDEDAPQPDTVEVQHDDGRSRRPA